MLAGGFAWRRSGDGELVFSGGLFQRDQGGIATVDEVFGRQQATTLETGVDAGQRLRIAVVAAVVATSVITLALSASRFWV